MPNSFVEGSLLLRWSAVIIYVLVLVMLQFANSKLRRQNQSKDVQIAYLREYLDGLGVKTEFVPGAKSYGPAYDALYSEDAVALRRKVAMEKALLGMDRETLGSWEAGFKPDPEMIALGEMEVVVNQLLDDMGLEPLSKGTLISQEEHEALIELHKEAQASQKPMIVDGINIFDPDHPESREQWRWARPWPDSFA